MKMLLGLMLLSTLSFAQEKQLYQVISQHPHDVEKIQPYIKTESESGRLWIVTLTQKAPASAMKYLKPITMNDVAHYRFTPAFEKTTPKRNIVEALKEVSISNIKASVEKLASYRTRAAGTVDNQNAIAQLSQDLESLGLTITTECYKPNACSVIGTKTGTTNSDKFMMVIAHMDSVGKDFAGADDNASGTASLLEMARVLAQTPTKQSIRFFITNGEEVNLLGARDYANKLAKSGEIKNLTFAINMDMVGYNKNGIVELETNKEYDAGAKFMTKLATTYTSLKTKITLGAWGSDHVPFLEKGVETILTIEDWSTKTPCYHQKCDTPDTLNYNYIGEITKLNIATLMEKDI